MSSERIVIKVIFGFFVVFISYNLCFYGYFTEADASDYIVAKKYYSDNVATKELYCESLKDHFLSEFEFIELGRTSSRYREKKANEEAKASADSIKAQGCKP